MSSKSLSNSQYNKVVDILSKKNYLGIAKSLSIGGNQSNWGLFKAIMPPSAALLTPIHYQMATIKTSSATSKKHQESSGEWDDVIDHLGITMVTPESPPNDSPVVLIRHGLSMMNIQFMEAGFDYEVETPEKHALEADPALMDAELHPIGIMQCENHQS